MKNKVISLINTINNGNKEETIEDARYKLAQYEHGYGPLSDPSIENLIKYVRISPENAEIISIEELATRKEEIAASEAERAARWEAQTLEDAEEKLASVEHEYGDLELPSVESLIRDVGLSPKNAEIIAEMKVVEYNQRRSLFSEQKDAPTLDESRLTLANWEAAYGSFESPTAEMISKYVGIPMEHAEILAQEYQ